MNSSNGEVCVCFGSCVYLAGLLDLLREERVCWWERRKEKESWLALVGNGPDNQRFRGKVIGGLRGVVVVVMREGEDVGWEKEAITSAFSLAFRSGG